MKLSSRQSIFAAAGLIIVLGFGWWWWQHGGTHQDFTPSSVAGIIIDETGKQLTSASGTVLVQGPTGTTGVTGNISDGAYKVSLANVTLPATVSCVPTNEGGASCYSGLVSADPSAAVEYLVCNKTANAAPEIQIVFLNHSGTPVIPQNTLVNTTDGGAQPALVGKSAAGAATAWVIFSPITSGNTYTFTYTVPGQQPTVKTFTAPADLANMATVSYTFYLN
jgi:hypothetical protein